jgi:hypothetical protein
MRRLVLFLLLCSACRTSEVGKCARDTDCTAGSRCDLTQDLPVCVIAQSGCFPACASGQVCQGAVCVNSGCNPACDLQHVCQSNSCVPVTSAEVAITSPAKGFASGTLQTTATARAPGGVSAVRFELRRGSTVIVAADGRAMPTAADPGNWAASLPLSGIDDGPAQLFAIAGTATSAAVALTVDQHAPAIALVTDTSGTLFAGGATATVVATVTDGTGAGVDPASVQLLVGSASRTGTASASGQYTFSVLLDDSVAPAGKTTSAAYAIAAKDLAGNAATLAGSAKEVLRVDRDAPQISAISITTAADYVSPSGRAFFTGGATPLTVTATIADGAGLAGAPCLRLANESGACAHPGSSAAGGKFSFSLPRSSTGDGSIPVDFTLSADDTLAAAATGAYQAEHHAVSAAQHVYFDNAPPTVVIAADAQPYARQELDGGPSLLSVTATITDPSGLSGPPQLVSGGTPIAPASMDGGVYLFQLNAADAPQGAEAAYTFSVRAQDNLSHPISVSATRFIDDAPPVALVKVFKDQEPGSGVAYPAAVTNTGYTGQSFIYSDTVHVKGNLSDRGGLGSATVHVDGTDLSGNPSPGAPRPLGCAAGTTSCDFDVTLPLNAAGNGAFHTGTSYASSGGSTIPSGFLTLVVEASDRARAGDGSAAANATSAPLVARTTRFLFQTTLPGAVTGLAVHPNNEVIATTDGGTDTVYGLAPDRPAVLWSWGADAGTSSGTGMGAISGPPAIDEGDSPSIYVAGTSGSVYALSPAGAALWHSDNLGAFSTGPAVTDGGTVVVPASDSATLWTASASGATSVATGGTDGTSSPLVLSGAVYLGTSAGLSRHALRADGTSGAAVTETTTSGPFLSLTTDGQRVFAANGNRVAGYDQSPAQVWIDSISASGEPTIDLAGSLNLGDSNSNVLLLDPLTGAKSTLFSLPSSKFARVPLQGSDGHTYYPRSLRVLLASEGAQLSWQFTPPTSTGTIWRALAMDCSGRLFAAASNLVFAFVTDDHGLADTPWPSYRRDARNTANAGAPKYGIATAAGCRQ